MCFRRKKKAADTANRQTESTGCHRVLPKETPCPYFITGWGILHRKLFLITTTHIILKKEVN